MKKFSLFAMAMCLLSACDTIGGGDVIWDIAPVEFKIFITDSGGHDLLDSTVQNNLIKDITLSYQGETYPVMTDQEYMEKTYGHSQTRAYMPTFYGLILRKYWSHETFTYGDFELVFGEFDGEESVDKREVLLTMPNGRQVSLAYKNHFRWKSNGNPKISRQFFLDNQELKDDAGKSGMYHFQYSESKGLEYVPD